MRTLFPAQANYVWHVVLVFGQVGLYVLRGVGACVLRAFAGPLPVRPLSSF